MTESRVEEILNRDSIRSMRIDPAPTFPPTASLREVIAAMQKAHAAAAVVSENGRVTGIFTERDILYRIVGLALNEEAPIGEVMTRDPKTLTPEDRIADAIRLMTDRGYRNIPLVDAAGRPVGMISARGIMEFIARHYPREVLNLPPDLDKIPQQRDGA